jgi:segregation and condensation protein B
VKQDNNRRGSTATDSLVPAVGAVIFASGEPVSAAEIAGAFGDVDAETIEDVIDALQRLYQRGESGLQVEKVAGGYRLATRPELAPWVRQFFRQRNRTRLSPAALETLAIVAYRQPVTAPEIQAIRGKDPAAALKNLVEKKLLRILGKKKVLGSPLLYGTSKQFLVHFGLDSLDDLPSIEDFGEFVEALEAGQERFWANTEPQPGAPASAAAPEARVDGEAAGTDAHEPEPS